MELRETVDYGCVSLPEYIGNKSELSDKYKDRR